jgi:hypothetical protein
MYVLISPPSYSYSYTPLPLPLGTLICCFTLPPSPLFSPSRESTFYCSYGSHSALPPASHRSRSARATLISDLVYNSRKRGGDSADRYFKATEMIAGVKDMRFQAIMPDTLHWLGVQKIDNMISMVRSYLFVPFFTSPLTTGEDADVKSDMKYNAIVDSGIPILRRYDIPDHLIPPVCPFLLFLTSFSFAPESSPLGYIIWRGSQDSHIA